LLPYLCTLTAVGWVNARTGKALMVTPMRPIAAEREPIVDAGLLEAVLPI
jgi:hypothetical protein